jgi:hypothetical protein
VGKNRQSRRTAESAEIRQVSIAAFSQFLLMLDAAFSELNVLFTFLSMITAKTTLKKKGNCLVEISFSMLFT